MRSLERERKRNLVMRADGKLVNVARKRGQLFVCASGCCCGHTERGHAAVETEVYHTEWERRRLRNKVHLTIGGCLGPCPLANVVLLLFDGQEIWFHSINACWQVIAIYDYIDQMLTADCYLAVPPELASFRFDVYGWDTPAASASPAPQLETGILFLTHADTDLLVLSKVLPQLPVDFPTLRATNLSDLKTDADVDRFLDSVLPSAEVIVLRLWGGRGSFPHGTDHIVRFAHEHDRFLICLPGTDELDPELMALSTVGVPVAHEVYAYLQLGGLYNVEHMLRFLSDHLLTTGFGYEAQLELPRQGLYHPDLPSGATLADWQRLADPAKPTAGLLFYRAHWLSGNTEFVDALVRSGADSGLNVLPVFAYSLKERDVNGQPAWLQYFENQSKPTVDVLLTAMSFAMGGVNPDGPTLSDWSVEALAALDVPVLQVIAASSSQGQWEVSLRGLNPLDTAMNVALPEFDGRIITVPVSFKEQETVTPAQGSRTLGARVVKYTPRQDRVDRVMGLAARFVTLRRKPNPEKKIAFILTNAPLKASRIGNAVGLDTPASLLRVFAAMQEAGYTIRDVPEDGDALFKALIDRCSYDSDLLTEWQLRHAAARVPVAHYLKWYRDLPTQNQSEMARRWGEAPGSAYVHEGHIALAGLELGNTFLALQPPRGYGMDPNAIYHTPDLAPPHHYYALYRWLRDEWGADAIVHMGKHGTLEWLPGKGVGVSGTCYPDLFLTDLPLIYPFIINDPGEGAQAKRRTHAVVVDHMIPPMTHASAYGDLAALAQLVDEYYQVEMLDPAKLPLLQQQIWQLLQAAKLDEDLKLMAASSLTHGDHTHSWDDQLNADGTPESLTQMRGKDFAHLMEDLDGYLCELAGAQIRDGLHILGHVASDEQLIDLLCSLTRLPNLEVPSQRAAVAASYRLDLEKLLATPGQRCEEPLPPAPSPPQSERGRSVFALTQRAGRMLVTNADAIEAIDALCHDLYRALAQTNFQVETVPEILERFDVGVGSASGSLSAVLSFVCTSLVPNLRRTQEEITNLLHALDGRYVPAGPSGAPTRGMAHVLPTGRNFYAVDPRALPSQVAWIVGQNLASELISRYVKEEGRYPESVGLSIWGTSAMRTHGDDIAQVFALLGVRPRWQPENRRLLGIELIPLAELGRPRVDVVCRISGFFRDAFPHLINLLDEAVTAVATLDEPDDQNFVRKHVQAARAKGMAAGLSETEARQQAGYRVFGSKPGTYGAGILPLIDEGNWQDSTDLAEVYVNWGGYAYTANNYGVDARAAFKQVLSGVSVAVKNQDNREHDLFDSDDYLQFHGGMIATIRALTGKNPRRYYGDNSDPAKVKVRDLREETLRVFRSRVVNPKWIASIQRHGYKGALELTATVDFLFGYDATAEVVEDWMYEQLASAYALDPKMQDFFKQSNPWAWRDIAKRLLEAIGRGMWANPGAQKEALESAFLEAETVLEERQEATVSRQ